MASSIKLPVANSWGLLRLALVSSILLASALPLSRVSAQEPMPPETSAPPAQPGNPASRKPPAGTPSPAQQTTPASQPAQDEQPQPNWPVNQQPEHAQVTWDSHGLSIDASNSSLQQIMRDVSTATGAQVEGLSNDERVFGAYGPGQARDVLAQLLQGAGYNVMLIGDQGQGAPRQILLSVRRASNEDKASHPGTPASNDDDSADSEDDQPEPQPPMRPGFPGGFPRNPQQRMEQFQRERQQMQQQQQSPQPQAPPSNPQN
jgi:hypothetical protein